MKPSFAPVIPKCRAEWLLSENNKTERKREGRKERGREGERGEERGEKAKELSNRYHKTTNWRILY